MQPCFHRFSMWHVTKLHRNAFSYGNMIIKNTADHIMQKYRLLFALELVRISKVDHLNSEIQQKEPAG